MKHLTHVQGRMLWRRGKRRMCYTVTCSCKFLLAEAEDLEQLHLAWRGKGRVALVRFHTACLVP